MYWTYYYLDTLNYSLALAGLVLLLATLFLFVDYFYFNSTYFKKWIKNYAWWIIAATTIGSVALSLVYSEHYGFIPCSLCWLQRIALYPQALIVLMAWKSKEHTYFPLYSIGLSIFGFGVAVYQYAYQMLPKDAGTADFLPCLADGSGDCSLRIIDEFGFVTFPFLSAVTFAFLIALYLHLRRG